MPIYEFLCRKCQRRFSILVRSPSAGLPVTCPACGASEPERLMSTFAYHRSAQTVREESGEPTLLPRPDFYKDPRNIGRWTEKRFRDLGLDVPPAIEEKIEAAREGEAPASECDMLGE